jgi:hypothetical protein
MKPYLPDYFVADEVETVHAMEHGHNEAWKKNINNYPFDLRLTPFVVLSL